MSSLPLFLPICFFFPFLPLHSFLLFMIERIYSNVAVFHDSERIITTYKFEDTEHSQVVKSHVAKAVSVRRQSRKQAAFSKQPIPLPVDSPMADDAVDSPIALDTPSSLKDDEEDMSVSDEAKETIEEEMTEADILEKLAQLKAEKHRLFQQVKNMMVSKEVPSTESVMLVSHAGSKQSHAGSPFDLQYATSQLAGSRPSSPPTSPRNRMSNYPSPSSPSDHGPVNHFKNAFKYAERPFSRTPYVRLKKTSIEREITHPFLTRAHLLTQERRPYSPNTPPLSPPTAGRRSPAVFGQPYRHGTAPRQGYFNRGMPPRRY
jgi:hypothetical protein